MPGSYIILSVFCLFVFAFCSCIVMAVLPFVYVSLCTIGMPGVCVNQKKAGIGSPESRLKIVVRLDTDAGN